MSDKPEERQGLKLPEGMSIWDVNIKFLVDKNLPVMVLDQQGLPDNPGTWGAMEKLIEVVLQPGWISAEIRRRREIEKSQLSIAGPDALKHLDKAGCRPGSTIIES